MRLKLDETMPRPLAEALRRGGHDVHTAADEGLLGRLATTSSDHPGAIVLRPRDPNQGAIVALALKAVELAADVDMKNRIATVDDERVRMRPPLALVTPQDQQ